MSADTMDAVTATTSPTLPSERRVHPLGRQTHEQRSGIAAAGGPIEVVRLGSDGHLCQRAAWPGLVLQMVGPLYGRRRQGLARALAGAAAWPPGSLARGP